MSQPPETTRNSARSPATPLSVTFITLNEERNIARSLKSVAWADETIVVDSGSQDRTCEIAASLGARVIQNSWPGYGQQKNFAQDQARFDWVLNLDADEVVSPELRDEIQDALAKSALTETGSPACTGYRIPRKTFYFGRWIGHGGWYPNYLVRLANRKFARWTEPELHEELKVEGKVGTLKNPLEHYTFESIEDQVRTNLRYARLGARALRNRGRTASVLPLLTKPLGKFFETFLLKRGFQDGLAGLIISVNAAHSIFLKYAFLYEPDEGSGERKILKSSGDSAG